MEYVEKGGCVSTFSEDENSSLVVTGAGDTANERSLAFSLLFPARLR